MKAAEFRNYIYLNSNLAKVFLCGRVYFSSYLCKLWVEELVGGRFGGMLVGRKFLGHAKVFIFFLVHKMLLFLTIFVPLLFVFLVWFFLAVGVRFFFPNFQGLSLFNKVFT